ncbi:neurite extension and migration factor [Protopterus annectens]|uniref:neurite extension and migration factor n=1 Tax=Protopterus annectens TaxID=7888 RepID=UPI001CFB6BB8|nr:neurite extension and migration factor [Protopterus annectens]
MDCQQVKDYSTQAQATLFVNGVCDHEQHDHKKDVKSPDAADSAATFSAPTVVQKENHLGQRVLHSLTTKEACLEGPQSPLGFTDVPEHISNESTTQAISLISCDSKGMSSWSLPDDCEKASFTMTEHGGMSVLRGDCLMQQSRPCLGCFSEIKDSTDTDPGISLKVGDINRDYDTCSVSDIGIQCMSTGETLRYGDQLLSDQLLSFPVHKSRLSDKQDAEKSDSDSEDPTQKNYYEGLLLDKCNGDEALLSNPSQEWGYFESFISESKIELLDLCSKNELSVNLFSEEDVDNYMFDDDDSTLGSDVCSLKIRYESFQDNMRDKTSALQEDAQFNFFPSIFTNCTKKETKNTLKRNVDSLQFRPDELGIWGDEEKLSISKNISVAECGQFLSSKRNHLLDSSNSAEDSGEYSDDSSCTGSSYDTLQDMKDCTRYLSRQHSNSSMQQNYGLRAKRKVRYSDDYLYDVDSIESEKIADKKEWPVDGPKEEDDDEWCPKKRRKASRKEPPVIIKYIIINRFKGEKNMLVKLSKVDATQTTVTLSDELLKQYDRLAPLKDFWQKKEASRLAYLKSTMYGRNSSWESSESFLSNCNKRKSKLANRHRIQRIRAIEQIPHNQGSVSYDYKHPCSRREDLAITSTHTIASINSSCTDEFSLNDITSSISLNCTSPEEEDKGRTKKILQRIKFRSEARLKCKKIKAAQEDDRISTNTIDNSPILEKQDPVISIKAESSQCISDSPSVPECHVDVDDKKSTLLQATCPPEKPVSSVSIATSVSVVPGGYLQTLLDGSDSSGNTNISYYSHHSSGQNSVPVPEKQFSPLPLAQSCVLSPPSESELQQSPHHLELEQNFTSAWQTQAVSNQQFMPDMRDTTVLTDEFGDPASLPHIESLSASGYSQMSTNISKMLYHKNYMQDLQLQPDGSYQVYHYSNGEGRFSYQRGTLNSDDGRLISFDSVGSLSVCSSNYSSLSLKSCEKDGEDDINDNFLAHCSPKLVIQQSIDEITPLKESTDLLDISNFTPDKFRHSSLSEMSPPDTPNLSPQIIDAKSLSNLKGFQDSSHGTLGVSEDSNWDCTLMQQPDQPADSFSLSNHQIQFHMFNDEDPVSLLEKESCVNTFSEPTSQFSSNGKVTKSKKKVLNNKNSCPSQSSTQKASKKAKSPKASKSEKTQNKNLKQVSKSTKKAKNATEVKTEKKQTIGSQLLGQLRNLAAPASKSLIPTTPHHSRTTLNVGKQNGVPSDWQLSKNSNASWSEPNIKNASNLLDDDQREFEEPSNILSNIASGMADVHRFMMASIEPLWGPVGHNSGSVMCQSHESNSLKLKTLKILASTPQEMKKKTGNNSSGVSRNRKSASKGSSKNKSLVCDLSGLSNSAGYSAGMRNVIFDKSYTHMLSAVNSGPAHKKMYRHKSSSKSARDENCKLKRPGREQHIKEPCITASFEKLR